MVPSCADRALCKLANPAPSPLCSTFHAPRLAMRECAPHLCPH
eukprot:gene6581-6325_t